MDILPLTTFIGAEIAGVDLRHLNAGLIQEIENVLHQYSVVFFRDQPELSPAEHTDLASAFGPVYPHPSNPRGSDFPGILKLYAGPDTKVGNGKTGRGTGNLWHSDVSCDKEPPFLQILQMHEVPPVGGDTVFSSMYAAYEALSPRMKQMLDGLTARHDGAHRYAHLRGVSGAPDESGTASKLAYHKDGYAEAVHPVVIRHHRSDRPALFVNREFTAELNDLPHGEGEALLKFLCDHSEGVDFQCRFCWSLNAVVIWDNRSVQHFAIFDYWPHVRTGRRAGVCGPAPKMWRLEEAPSTLTLNLKENNNG
jgi:taurine dioxygenase